jgi:hypothetical protein
MIMQNGQTTARISAPVPADFFALRLFGLNYLGYSLIKFLPPAQQQKPLFLFFGISTSLARVLTSESLGSSPLGFWHGWWNFVMKF